MDSALSSIGNMLFAIGGVLVTMGIAASIFGGEGTAMIVAGGICAGVGAILLVVGGMMAQRKDDSSLQSPPSVSQAQGSADPTPGGTLDGTGGTGYQPPAGGDIGGGSGEITFQGQINLTGTFSGTVAQSGSGGSGQGTLALESGAAQVAVRQ